jgi:glycerol-3-phosphate dehydrogenase
MIAALSEPRTWDVLVVGGGATGLGVAVDAASRGFSTLLLEQSDFAKSTSSRSTKLVHGGVRYLQQGNLSLVIEALRERGLLRQNAPHLVRDLEFIVPNYDWWEGPFYGIGLKVYDMLAGKLGLGSSKWLSREETLESIPTLEPEALRGGVLYHDAQFDDARLAVTLARTAVDQGAVVANYVRVTDLIKERSLVCGVQARDLETGALHSVRARVVVNATGVFSDGLQRLDDSSHVPTIQASRGVHVILDGDFLRSGDAIMVPRTDDGRVLFAIPWYDHTVVGTTDTPVDGISIEPRASDEEIDFLLEHAARYLTRDPSRSDVRSVFAGLRPLVREADATDTAQLSRDHVVRVSASGLVSIAGGKWTTYRKMAEDTLDIAVDVGALDDRPCVTKELKLHGWRELDPDEEGLRVYGTDRKALEELVSSDPQYGHRLCDTLPYRVGEVVWAARHEMARTVEDVLARRTRALLLNARASQRSARTVARILAVELKRDDDWEARQVAEYTELADGYIV